MSDKTAAAIFDESVLAKTAPITAIPIPSGMRAGASVSPVELTRRIKGSKNAPTKSKKFPATIIHLMRMRETTNPERMPKIKTLIETYRNSIPTWNAFRPKTISK